MPLLLSELTTPGGRRVIKALTRGDVTVEDARGFNAAFAAGGRYAGLPLLGVMEAGTNLTVESRRVFTETTNSIGVNANVVSSAPLRVMLNFMIKTTALRGNSNKTAVFSTEAEALSWLDQQLAASGS